MTYEKKLEMYRFFKELDRFDWYYQMSDDHRVWRAGQSAHDKLKKWAHDSQIRELELLLHAYELHMFSGEPWGTNKQPKPVCPVDIEEIEEEDRV